MFSTALPYVNSISSLYMVIIPSYDQTLDPWLQSFVYKRNDKAVVIGSGSTSVTVSGGGGEGLMAPFTAIQWQELEQQALIYKYMVAGVPVPSDLVLPIRRSLEALSARLFHHPALGYSYSGKKFDPEPGRCRRTDGKKWRCAKNAYQESKYCERHMNRGRNRSRKPVESQSTDSTGSGKGSYQNVSSSGSSSQSLLYPISNSGTCNNGSNSIPYGTNSKDHLRYAQGVSVNADDQNYISEDSWRLMPSENPLLDPQNDCYLGDSSLQLNMRDAFEPIIDANPISSSDQRQQHCFLGTRIDHEQHSIHEWSKAKETCSD